MVLCDVKILVRDGIQLSADIFFPKGQGPFPAIFNMTPYGTDPENNQLCDAAAPYVEAGYAYVAVDVRGRYNSEGEWYAHRAEERFDGSDVIDWIASQSWSNGKVATLGHSYSGWNQWLTAQERNPHHIAMMSSGSPTNLFVDWPNLDGVLSLQPIATWALGMMYGRGCETEAPKIKLSWKEALWHLPISDLDELMSGHRIAFWQEWLTRDALDEYWQALQMNGKYEKIQFPTFNVSGWYDARLKGQVNAYLKVKAASPIPDSHMLIIGPWLHSPMGTAPKFAMRDFGPQGNLNLPKLRIEWLDHIMNGAPKPGLDGVLYFLQGTNEWRQATQWPLADTQFTNFYLQSGGSANTLHGDGRLGTKQPQTCIVDQFIYDPNNPVPTNWSPTRAEGILPKEPQDNRGVEEREDVLVYSTGTLTEGLEVSGPVNATIYFSTDVMDTDITVKLLDVDPQGVAFQLTYGIARARYRNSYEKPELLVPGEVYAVDIELQPTSNFFPEGHRIRIEISGSNFPFYARNLNTGANNYTTTEAKIANTRVWHGPDHPSRIVLPIIPVGRSSLANFSVS